jgi:DNA-damage-inducible protein J
MSRVDLKNTDVRSRVSLSLKNNAAEVLDGCGLNVSSAIRLFLEQVVQENGLPFPIKSKRPSSSMRNALSEAKLIKKHHANLQSMLDEMERNNGQEKSSCGA